MRAAELVALATCCSLLVTWHLVHQSRQAPSTEILSWSTVPPVTIPARWRDTGGGLNSQILKRFVIENVKKTKLRQFDKEKNETILKEIKGAQLNSSGHIENSLFVIRPCPQGPVVAAEDGGRLGNKAWEYSAVWSLSKLLGRSGYVPTSMLKYLSFTFSNLSLKSLESISHCNINFTKPVKRYQLIPLNMLQTRYTNQSLLLHKWMKLPDPIVMYRNDLRNELKFYPGFIKFAYDTFENISKKNQQSNMTFIGVHVRRTDFREWLPAKFNTTLVGAQYFLDSMSWFRNKLRGQSLVFLIVSDDPHWCAKEIVSRTSDSVLISHIGRSNPAQDLALLSLCNHTIIDYGTFGEIGAFLAGGITVSAGVDAYFNDVVTQQLNWKIWKLKNETTNIKSLL